MMYVEIYKKDVKGLVTPEAYRLTKSVWLTRVARLVD